FIVDVQRSATRAQRAVIDDGALIRRDALADSSAKGGRSLAVEIAFQTMTDRLVQQDPRPTGPQHDGHRPCRCRGRLEIHDRAAYGFRNEILPTIVLEESPKAVAPAAAAVALLATAILLDDHGDIHAHERTDVRRQRAVACHDQYDFMAAREARHHLRHTRIHATRFDIDPL